MSLIDRIPLWLLLALAVVMALAPFEDMRPQSHLLEKLRMLFSGTLKRPLDIFDLFFHGTFVLLPILKIVRMVMTRGPEA